MRLLPWGLVTICLILILSLAGCRAGEGMASDSGRVVSPPIESLTTEAEMQAAIAELMFAYGMEARWTPEHEIAIERMEAFGMHRRIPTFLLPAIKAGTFPTDRAVQLYQSYQELDDDPEWRATFQTAIIRLNAYN